MQISVAPVASKSELLEFIRFPRRLYHNDPNYVPYLELERKEFFDPKKNPLFDFTEVAYFMARNTRGEIVGTITAHINRRHNEFAREQAGFFGFFESVDDWPTAQALHYVAAKWLRERGMKCIRGPFNFSPNDECGLLVEGFNHPPTLMMPYSKPYYPALMDRLGYKSIRELLAYDYFRNSPDPEFLDRLSQRVRQKVQVTVRPLDLRNFEAEIERAFALYNSAWEKNWGFIPMTEAEFKFIAKNLKPVINPSLALIAEMEGRAVAFSIALPDFNQVLKKRHGRLLPLGLFHFFFGRRKIDAIRVLAMGVMREHRGRGIDVLLYHATWKAFLAGGYQRCEMSWILEDNHAMTRACEKMGGKITKRYRIFEKEL